MTDFRAAAHTALNALHHASDAALANQLAQMSTPDTIWDFAHPIGRVTGPQAVEAFYLPLRLGLTAVRRRDEFFIGGPNRRANGGQWIASLTHYVGTHSAPLFGVPPSHRLAFLRSGEFYRIEEGRITEAKILFDLLDLMRQAGRSPLPRLLGTEMLFPGPATHDGVLPMGDHGEATLDLVEAMLADLHTFDPDTNDSAGQTGAGGYWHEDMLWYGPGGIGSNYRWDGFVKDHRADFLRAFPDRKGGDHYCRIGDGDFAAVSGWPSMTMTHQGAYLGQPADGRALTLRVMDFYRCAGGQIHENWVCLDYLDLFAQMGRDLIAEAQSTTAAF
ncbi:MAG: ester cyclase [Pseudomonadota bacterium]